MSSVRHSIPLSIAFILIILYRNSLYLTRLSTNLNRMTYFTSFSPNFTIDLGIHAPTQMIMLQDGSLHCPVYLATNDKESGDDKQEEQPAAEEPAPAAEDPTPAAEEPAPAEDPPRQLDDEYGRFRDPIRPPESHYGPGPFRDGRKCGVIPKLSGSVMAWSFVVTVVI